MIKNSEVARANSRKDLSLLACLGFFLVMLPGTERLLGNVTGFLWPVVTEATILEIEDIDGKSARLTLTAEKLRNCQWRAVSCSFGSRSGESVPVPCEFTDAPEIRGMGTLAWSGFVIGAPAHRLDEVFSDVYHSCNPLFERKSRYLTGEFAN